MSNTLIKNASGSTSRLDVLPTYEMKFEGDESWRDISMFVDSLQTTVSYNLLSSDLKSCIDTVDFTFVLISSTNATKVEERANLLDKLFDAVTESKTVLFRMTWTNTEDGNPIPVFTGAVDLSSISIQSTRILGAVSLSAYDASYLLDENIATSFEYPSSETATPTDPFPVSASLPIFTLEGESIVRNLLHMAGYADADIATDSEEVTDTVRYVTHDTEDNRTYRDFLDQLLLEHCAVFTFDRDGKFRIKNLAIDTVTPTRAVGSDYRLAEGVQASTDIYDNDGVKLQWSTLNVRKNATLYVDDLPTERDDYGVLEGEEILPEAYYPEDSDIDETYQEFDATFLDRRYLTNLTREQNEDLSFIAARNVAYEKQQKGTELTLPIVGTLTSNPEIYPTKARFVWYNPSTTESAFLQAFRIQGDALYRERLNYYTVPNLATNPEEVESEFIYTESAALRYSNFYRLFRKYSQLSYTWSENEDRDCGEIVTVSLKDTNVSTNVIVSTVELSFKGAPSLPVVANLKGVAFSAYNAEEPLSRSYMLSGSSAEDGVGIVNIIEWYGLSNSSKDEPTEWTSDIPTMSESQRFLWNYEVTTYSDGTTRSTAKHVIGVYGTGITSVVNWYGLSHNPVVEPVEWSYTEIPEMTPVMRYLWNYEVTTYSDGSTTTSTKHIIGVYGEQGIQGEGFDIQYAVSDSYKAYPGENNVLVFGTYVIAFNNYAGLWGELTWSSAMPVVGENQYLWQRSRKTDTDNPWTYSLYNLSTFISLAAVTSEPFSYAFGELQMDDMEILEVRQVSISPIEEDSCTVTLPYSGQYYIVGGEEMTTPGGTTIFTRIYDPETGEATEIGNRDILVLRLA